MPFMAVPAQVYYFHYLELIIMWREKNMIQNHWAHFTSLWLRHASLYTQLIYSFYILFNQMQQKHTLGCLWHFYYLSFYSERFGNIAHERIQHTFVPLCSRGLA